jgi:hypothetical protein
MIQRAVSSPVMVAGEVAVVVKKKSKGFKASG